MSARTDSSASTARMLVVGGVVLAAVLALAFWPDGGSGDAAAFDLVAPSEVLTTDSGGPAAVGTSVTGTGEVVVPVPDEPTLVIFLAHWCPHCQREVPVVQQWLDDGRLPDGVAMRGVATAIDDQRPNHPPNAWLETEGWEVPTVIDDGRIADAFGLTNLPFWAAVDADGTVVATASGELTPAEIDQLATTITP